MDFVTLLDGFDEFIRIRSGIIYKNFNIVLQFIFCGKQDFPHLWKLPNELTQTFTYCSPLYCHHLQAVGELTMRFVNVDSNRHRYLIPTERELQFVYFDFKSVWATTILWI